MDWLSLVLVASFATCFHCQTTTEERVDELEETVASMEATVGLLSRQMMLQQLFIEERIRSDGCSGLKQLRHNRDGTRPYFSETHTLNSVASIHDHTNNIRTVGMGEVIAVLNGVEFRTRHNDYKLNMPSTTTKDYHDTEPIPFPDVPPSVLNKTDVSEQIAEMREYFRAWSLQKPKIRDYRPYFKPVLCYMEAAWSTETESLDEPFDSDRHHIDAQSWFDLQEKIRYTSMTGLKDNNENYAFLPTTIVNVTDGVPHFAQWNYRILCHPIRRQIWLDRLKVADDLSTRMARSDTLDELETTRAARFRINGKNSRYDKESSYNNGLIDDIMYEIPGKDNYRGYIRETSFDLLAYKANRDQPLNAARYHRVFKIAQTGAMGLRNRHRGFKDENLFVSLNKQPRVSPFSVTDCDRKDGKRVCKTFESRVSYAIPLEIIFMTPLLKWNPYDIEYKEGALAKTVTEGGRNGGADTETAWNGTHSRLYYRTPVEFFQGSEVDTDPADTVRGVAGVLDQEENVRKVVASGTRIFLPNINGIGSLRTRYPIMPIHGECTSVWKELDALKEIVMRQSTYSSLLYEAPSTVGAGWKDVGSVHLEIAETFRDPPGHHSHDVYVSASDLIDIKGGSKTLKALSSRANNHQHTIEIAYNAQTDKYYIEQCDGKKGECWDKHPLNLIIRS